MIGHHCLLPIDVYNALRISHQQDFAHQVSKTVATILWISFPYRPDRYSRTTLHQEEKAAITHLNKDIKIANP